MHAHDLSARCRENELRIGQAGLASLKRLQHLASLTIRAAAPDAAVELFDPTHLRDPDAVVVVDADTAKCVP